MCVGPFPSLLDCRFRIPTETKVESGTSESKRGTSFNVSTSEVFGVNREVQEEGEEARGLALLPAALLVLVVALYLRMKL